ncbi:MAG: S9 family peptidase [Ignavibacteriales bacterium CG12_big_fil_rev_8_21_14_0_65_30_8]|nr:MAG: S9 family peptidase [Ignavibacteriales bacterium CG12_big_fil_rev_8_21_14_0_65_30_8]
MKAFRQLLVLFVVVLFIQPIIPQETDKSILTIDRLFKNYEFRGERFGPARFLDNGKSYTTLEPSETVKRARDIIKYDTESGDRTILVSAELLIPKGDTTALSISNYEWSSDKNMLLIFTNTKRVWRYNTKGDYWVLNLNTEELKKLGGNAPESSLMFTKFSPDNKKVAYVSEHNVFIQDLSDWKITQLTFDGSNTTINGTFDWVYEEELDDRDGFRWSPDSKNIAYWQLDASGIGEFLMINTTDSIYSHTIPVQYPKVGTINSNCRVGVVSAEGGKTTWMKVPGDMRNDYYIPRMGWPNTSDEIYVQRLNRPQNKLDIMLCNIKTGDVKTILKETDDAWIDINDDMHWFNEGRSFTWISERDGWRHMYVVSRDGKDVKLVTPGNFDVISVSTIDFDNGWIYYIASPNNATQRYLFRVSLNGNGKIEKITPKDLSGVNSYQISDGSNYAIHTYTNINTVATIDLVELPSHKVIRNLVANKKLKEKFDAVKKLPIELFKVKIENGVELDGWMVKPPDFDPSKKYPVLYYLYGHPAAQTVMDRWSGAFLWYMMLAQHGYIVVSIDNRGTPAPKGRAFRKHIYKDVGTLASIDQAEAMKVLMNNNHFIDPERIGVWGWSGGAVSTLNLMFRYPDIFSVGMAVAPVTDERLYDTIYMERYMGLLKDNEEGYIQSAAVTFAKDLKGKLLVVHGTGDDNVHYQNTERLIDELVKNNKPFTMMAYPNRSHGIYEGPGTRLHLYSLLTSYLETNLPAGGR